MKLGGPRFWRERLNDSGLKARVCGRNTSVSTEVKLAVRTTGETATQLVAGTVWSDGNEAHLAPATTGPDGDPCRIDIMAQWCFPSRRQHTGRFDSGLEAESAGPISDRLKRTTRVAAHTRRTESSYASSILDLLDAGQIESHFSASPGSCEQYAALSMRYPQSLTFEF